MKNLHFPKLSFLAASGEMTARQPGVQTGVRITNRFAEKFKSLMSAMGLRWIGAIYGGAFVVAAASAPAQNLFESDLGSQHVYELSTNATKSTFASGLDNPQGLAFNSAGAMFEADALSGNIYEFTPGGVQSTFATGLGKTRALAFNRAGGTESNNYTLSEAGGSVIVTPLPVVLTGTRLYDGTATAQASILTISNDLDGADLTLSGSATLADTNAGSQSVTDFTGLALNGSAATNYTLTGASGSVTIISTPLAVTLPATAIVPSSAILNASVSPQAAATAVYFVYGATTNYGNSTGAKNIGSGTSAVSISSSITKLLPDTVYHFQAVASNVVGITLGGDLTFATAPAAPTVTNLPALAITSSGATLAALVNPEGDETTVSFVYGATAGYGFTNVLPNIGDTNVFLAISNSITGLLPGTLYHYQVLASNGVATTVDQASDADHRLR